MPRISTVDAALVGWGTGRVGGGGGAISLSGFPGAGVLVYSDLQSLTEVADDLKENGKVGILLCLRIVIIKNGHVRRVYSLP